VVGRQNADIADTLQLRDVAMATNFGTALAANELWRKKTTWGFRVKDGFFISHLWRWEMHQAGDCQVGNWHVNCQHSSFNMSESEIEDWKLKSQAEVEEHWHACLLGLTTVETRRLRGDLIEVFKILKWYVHIDQEVFLGDRLYNGSPYACCLSACPVLSVGLY